MSRDHLNPHTPPEAAFLMLIDSTSVSFPSLTRAIFKRPWRRASASTQGAALGLVLACSTLSCSDDHADDADGHSSAIETGIDEESLTGSMSEGGKSSEQWGGLDEDGRCQELGVHEGCAGEVYEGEAVPLDLYLMFDQSGSMSTKVDKETGATRMDIVRTAVEAFLKDDESVGLGVGIGYFGHQPLRETTCDPDDYATPDVEIGALPDTTKSLLSSLDERQPTGETPTGAAIRGACDYVANYKQDHAGRNPAILLVTDGEPKAPLSEALCAPTLDDAVLAAEECFQEQGVRIYVLGVGPSLVNLRVIAEAGGTETAFLADKDNAEQVLEAFVAVRRAAQLPCELEVEPSALERSDVNFDDSTVAYLDFACEYRSVKAVREKADCDENGGWYFDDRDSPHTIRLCDVTCGDVKSTGRQLYYSIGCSLDELIR